jgi:hypothetical protein
MDTSLSEPEYELIVALRLREPEFLTKRNVSRDHTEGLEATGVNGYTQRIRIPLQLENFAFPAFSRFR